MTPAQNLEIQEKFHFLKSRVEGILEPSNPGSLGSSHPCPVPTNELGSFPSNPFLFPTQTSASIGISEVRNHLSSQSSTNQSTSPQTGTLIPLPKHQTNAWGKEKWKKILPCESGKALERKLSCLPTLMPLWESHSYQPVT